MVKVLALWLIMVVLSSPLYAQTVEYDWLTIGKKSGSQTVEIHSPKERHIAFEFNDRGRGPETTTIVRLNDKGIPVYVSTSGLNYTKGEVNETFSVEAETARWQSASEQGEADFHGDAFYLSNSAPPEYMAMLVRAVLQDDDGSLPLLPSGRASVDKVKVQRIQINAAEKVITLYAINGLQPMPGYLWLDENLELFGVDYGWFGLTPSGWETHIDLLKAQQEQHTAEFIGAVSQELGQPVEGLLVINNPRMLDTVNGEVIEVASVVILDGRITAVYEQAGPLPGMAQVIDADGQFLMPALWDMHAHISPDNYLNYLAMGVTNVRDMANDPEYIVQARRDIPDQQLAAPNIHAMGFIDKKSEFAAPTGMLAESLEQALAFVDEYAQRGFYGIKLYSSIEPQWVKPIVDHAHERGLTVLGHIPSGMNANDALDAGFDEITHINMVMLNFLGARQLDTRTPKRFTEVGERAHAVDWQSAEVEAFIGRMAKEQIAHDPTLSIFQDMFYNEPGKMSIVFRETAEHIPPITRRGLINTASFNDGNEASYARAGQISRVLIKRMHDAGVRLLPGTDNALPGMTLIRELQFYVEAGISPVDVLRLATLEPARHMGLEHDYGSIQRGKRAHLILIDGDPSKDLADLYKVNTVIKDRMIYQSAAILQRQGFVSFQ